VQGDRFLAGVSAGDLPGDDLGTGNGGERFPDPGELSVDHRFGPVQGGPQVPVTGVGFGEGEPLVAEVGDDLSARRRLLANSTLQAALRR
jgi:hypothetical protein